MGGTASVSRNETEFTPQLPIDTVLPVLEAIGDDVATIDKLHKANLLPHNKYDLWRSFGWAGYPYGKISRDDIVCLFVRSR